MDSSFNSSKFRNNISQLTIHNHCLHVILLEVLIYLRFPIRTLTMYFLGCTFIFNSRVLCGIIKLLWRFVKNDLQSHFHFYSISNREFLSWTTCIIFLTEFRHNGKEWKILKENLDFDEFAIQWKQRTIFQHTLIRLETCPQVTKKYK